MKNFIARVALAGLPCAAAYGQPVTDPPPTFEVASVKPSRPPEGRLIGVGCSGGPETKDPGLFNCENMSSYNLLMRAYNVKRYEISGPDWLDSTRFDISAKIPPGTTKEQFRLMQQNLLAERFKLTLHHEKKQMQMYELTVARNGPKLKESVPAPKGDDATPKAQAREKLTLGSDGFPVLPPNENVMAVMAGGWARRQQFGETVDQLAQFLSGRLGHPVINATGLTGKYDIVLSWVDGLGIDGTPLAPAAAPDGSEPMPTLIQAVQSLGLKLEQKKGPVDILVVDHMEKTPAEN